MFFDSNGYFVGKNCKAIEKWILSTINLKTNVTNTGTFLNISYVADGELVIYKLRIPSSVLYCLKEKDFNDFFKEVNDNKTYLRVKV